ncbi:ketopantoate reductase family protein [Litchfieldia alkalitelluris]|uniref:ketopantoate reductase family protein n=1 Tax=Litchfieldia alkalitelluris TaxID=304268 RepID=UPI000998B98A|nr:2-dehydropantoate 2-reductase [Litchfieldia alkalitelluris]
MHITIIGAGAIGGVLGAYLSRSGQKVTFCDIAEDHVRKMNETGLRIEGPEETFTISCKAYVPEKLVEQGESLEIVLLCVKAQHTEQAITQILPLLNEKSYVVSLQNGLCEKQIARLIGAERTVGCFVNFSADYLEPGRILYGGIAALYLGELDGKISKRVTHLQEVLSCWGPAQVTDNIWGYLWGKMSYAGLLYATALVDETMATVVSNKELRPTLMELCSEILEVADCEGIHPLGFDDWEPELVYPRKKRDSTILDCQLEKLAKRMASNRKTKSGIWRDLAVRKRKTEIEQQLIPIVEIADNYKVNMPLTIQLITQIQEIEVGVRQMDWKNLYELKELYEVVENNEPKIR